jgi:hypothetical protein
MVAISAPKHTPHIPFQCSIPRLDYLGLFHLFKLFLRYCYDPEDPNQDLFAHTYVPKPNDFSDLSEYFVRKVSGYPLNERLETNIFTEPYKRYLANPVPEWQIPVCCPEISD